MVTFQTEPGDGQVKIIDVTSTGAGSDSEYDFFTTDNGVEYVSYSTAYVRLGTSGARIDLSSVTDTGFAESTASSAVSNPFSIEQNGQTVNVNLTQTLKDIKKEDSRVGGQLEQVYTFSNPTDSEVFIEFFQFSDIDLEGSGNYGDDGGGRLVVDGVDWLFITDTTVDANTETELIAVRIDGGEDLPGTFDVDQYSTLTDRLENGDPLLNGVRGDGDDADELVDIGNGADIAVARGKGIRLAPGASSTLTVYTAYGQLSLSEITQLDPSGPIFTSITRQDPATAVTGADSLVFQATFNKAVKNIDASDFMVDGSTATVNDVSAVNDLVYNITVSGGDLADYNGTVGLNLSTIQDITDLADNALSAGEPATDEIYTLDNTLPTGQLTPVAEGKVLEINSLGTANTLKLQLEQIGVNSVSDLRIFTTDALGNNRTQIGSFSLLEGGQLPAAYAPEFSLDSSKITGGQFLQFELVQNGLARVAIAKLGDNGQIELDFGDGTRLLAAFANQNPTTNLLRDDAATIDLTGVTDPLSIEFMVYREAAFNNSVGLYRTDDASGGIADPLTGTMVKPGEAGYKEAALARQLDVRLTGQNGQVSSFSTDVLGGGFLGMFLVVNGTDPLANEVYFSHMGANTDGNDHAKVLGNNTFGFEDLAGLGDRDFNDVVVKFAVV